MEANLLMHFHAISRVPKKRRLNILNFRNLSDLHRVKVVDEILVILHFSKLLVFYTCQKNLLFKF